MSGTYTVTVTNSSGCTATASTFVSINALGGYTWTGATNTDWATVTNWIPTAPAGGPNGCTQSVTIPNTVNDPVISSAVSIGNATINDNAQLTLNANLSICKNFTGGTTTSALITGNSHLIVNGTAAETMTGSLNINYLEINNSSGGVISSGNVTVNKAIIMTKGNLSNQGTMVLVSNASGDAYLDNFTSLTAGSYLGNLTVQRYISNTADGYRDFSSPVTATVANLNNAFPVFGQNNVDCWYAYSPYPNVQIFKEPLIIATGNFFEHWLSYTALTNPLAPMRGISARTYVGAPYTINLTGYLNANNLSVPITHTTSATPASDGWNFIGNPYASPIKWTAVKAMNPSVVNGSYYVYHTTGEYTGNWASFNGTTGVNGGTDVIATSQGFFIQTATSGTFSMNNSVKTSTPTTFFGVQRPQDNELRLTLTKGDNKDEIVTYTDANATAGFDADMDALKMAAGSTVSMGFSLSGKDYAINVMDVINDQTILPLNISGRDTGIYTLEATALNIPGLTAYLLDGQTGTLSDLSKGSVQLKLNGSQTYSGRYSLVFQAAAVSTGITTADQSKTNIYAYGNQVHVLRSSATAAKITVTNLLGQEIREIPTQSEKTVFELPAIQPWYAIIKVTEGEKTTVRKVIISSNQ